MVIATAVLLFSGCKLLSSKLKDHCEVVDVLALYIECLSDLVSCQHTVLLKFLVNVTVAKSQKGFVDN